jgi:viroplasmin and RNaseH domain-containing protein
MAHNFYAVKRGFDKKQNKEVMDLIVDDWYEVAPLIKGYSNARYKGFDTKEEAETWLSVVDKIDAERRAKSAIDQAKKDIGIESELPLEETHEDVHVIADEYADAAIKLLKEYKKRKWSLDATIGHLTRVLINEAEQIYK